MPIVDGKYKNPGWVNNGPPYINASELNDMGNTLENLDNGKDGGSGLSDDAKAALLALLEKVAYVDENGQQYWDALHDALYPPVPPASLVSITAVFEQGSHVIYDNASLDDLKRYLNVTAYYDDGTSGAVTGYELEGTLAEGTSTITVNYDGKTDTFTVTVTKAEEQWTLKWDYTDGGLPAEVARNDWNISATAGGLNSVSFEPDLGLKWNGHSGGYTITPKNYQKTNKGVMEVVVRFTDTVNEFLNVRATLNTASDTLIGFLFKGGVKVNGSGSSYAFIDGTEVSANEDHVLRVERTTSSGKVFLDGVEVYSGELRALSGSNNVLISLTDDSGGNGILYVRAIRFRHIS